MSDIDELETADVEATEEEASTSQPWGRRLVNTIFRSRRERILGIAAVVALLLAALTAFIVRPAGDLPEGTVAEVGDHTITVKQLDSRVRALKALYGITVPTTEAGKATFDRDAAKSAVFAQVIDDAAVREGVVFGAKEIDDMVAKLIKERYPDGGRDAFIKALGDMGATEAQVREELEQQAIVGKLFDKITAEVTVSDADLQDAFTKRKAALATPEQRRISNIVVSSRPEAQAVLRLLRSGKAFATVAKQYSIDGSTNAAGGVMGLAARDQLEDAYAKAAFAAKARVPFGPVETTTGWHVGIVTAVVPGKPAVFSEVKDALRQVLESERALVDWRAWMKKELKSADITYADKYEPEDLYALPNDSAPADQ